MTDKMLSRDIIKGGFSITGKLDLIDKRMQNLVVKIDKLQHVIDDLEIAVKTRGDYIGVRKRSAA